MGMFSFFSSGIFWGAFLVELVLGILYLYTLHMTLAAVSPQNRKMEPGLVWLMLIPLFNLVWQFFVVFKIRDSLQAEFTARNLPSGGDYGYGVGLAMCILVICCIIPILGLLAAVGALVCWIIYWVKMAGYKNQLKGAA